MTPPLPTLDRTPDRQPGGPSVARPQSVHRGRSAGRMTAPRTTAGPRRDQPDKRPDLSVVDLAKGRSDPLLGRTLGGLNQYATALSTPNRAKMRGANLTDRQHEVLEHIREHLRRWGLPPSRSELRRSLGLASATAVNYHLRALQRKGWIHLNPGKDRGIQLLREGTPVFDPGPFGLPLPRCGGNPRLLRGCRRLPARPGTAYRPASDHRRTGRLSAHLLRYRQRRSGQALLHRLLRRRRSSGRQSRRTVQDALGHGPAFCHACRGPCRARRLEGAARGQERNCGRPCRPRHVPVDLLPRSQQLPARIRLVGGGGEPGLRRPCRKIARPAGELGFVESVENFRSRRMICPYAPGAPAGRCRAAQDTGRQG